MAGVFNNAVLTQKGIALLAKAQGGLCSIVLTKAATGDGSYTDGEDISQQTELKNKIQEFNLETVTVWDTNNVLVKFIITNYIDSSHILTTGYYVKELGIYATDPDEGTILYAIATAVTDQWDYMPAYDNLLPQKIIVDMLTKVVNADDVTVIMPNREYLYDEDNGDEYELGIKSGEVYYKKEGTNVKTFLQVKLPFQIEIDSNDNGINIIY